ncbi:MAG TPA: peptidylprolyl isomerase [Epsilonproteobacteria bacterium]|nr:peptidylprolyl isomerase [Campylobacterota bacterium]
MTINAENSVVSLEYTLTQPGQSDILDSNKGGAPLQFITGKGHIIPGLEKALVGMKKGESSDILVQVVDAYGEINPEAFQTLPKEQFEGIELQEGMKLYGQGENGQTVQVVVKSFNDTEVTIDFNHPLAGKDLLFSVTIADAREATADEAMTGQLACDDIGGCCSTSTTNSHNSGGCCGGGHCH